MRVAWGPPLTSITLSSSSLILFRVSGSLSFSTRPSSPPSLAQRGIQAWGEEPLAG